MDVEKLHSIYFKGSNSCQAICRQKMVGEYSDGASGGDCRRLFAAGSRRDATHFGALRARQPVAWLGGELMALHASLVSAATIRGCDGCGAPFWGHPELLALRSSSVLHQARRHALRRAPAFGGGRSFKPRRLQHGRRATFERGSGSGGRWANPRIRASGGQPSAPVPSHRPVEGRGPGGPLLWGGHRATRARGVRCRGPPRPPVVRPPPLWVPVEVP